MRFLLKLSLFLLLFSFPLIVWAYTQEEKRDLQQITIKIKNKDISWIVLYKALQKALDKKFLNPKKSFLFLDKVSQKFENRKGKTADNFLFVIDILKSDYREKMVANYHNKKAIILEGWNIFDIDTYLTQRGLIEKWEYISYVENSEKIQALWEFFDFIDKQKTLEGYLYPDTYNVNPENFKLNNFVIAQLTAFENKVYNRLFIDEVTKKQLYSTNIIDSVVNLASIVEKEEKNAKEKSTVAGILKKRLKEFRYIWADITVCYSHRITSNQCKFYVSKYIKIKLEYNTRTNLWLPPTPIGNPSFETVNATLNSKTTQYYYYLHDKNWNIYYGKNYEEHKNNIKKYLNK